MKISFTEYLGRDPTRYAQKALRECGFNAPPICEKTIAGYLKLQIEEFTDDDILAFTGGDPEQQRQLLKNIQKAPSFTRRKGNQKIIMVYQKNPLERKRLNVFHECAHELPWHRGLDYLCHENPINPLMRNSIEREAFVCAVEYMMPGEMFRSDLLSMDTSIATISKLHSRYISSMEATSIRYASLHPGFCSIAMLEPVQYYETQTTSHVSTSSDQLRFAFEVEQTPSPKAEVKKYRYRVKYSVKSRRFPQYIQPGRGITEHNPIIAAQVGGKPIKMEIPATAFGSSTKYVYQAECMSLGNTGTIMALLWVPDRQERISF